MQMSTLSEGLHGTNMVSYATARRVRSKVVYAHVATDNLQVQWRMQDHYEVVRKVGRGKYSEVRV